MAARLAVQLRQARTAPKLWQAGITGITKHPARRHLSSTSLEQPTDAKPLVVPSADEMESDPQLAGLGYPQLPQISRQHRSPRGWWDRQERINFNETLPENDDTLSMWGVDEHAKKPSTAFAELALASGLFALFGCLVYTQVPARPASKREYPYDGLVKEMSGTDDQQYANYDPEQGLPSLESKELNQGETGNVIGGLKASLSNDNNSQEAKDHNQSSLDKLQEAGASTFTSASEPTDK
ncbi:hypothetical protein EMMF5_006196 [Cystobasidiomycetes sp. EMM_F5]